MNARMWVAALVAQLVFGGCLVAQEADPPPPAVSGYVTSMTAGGFEVNGRPIVLDARTKLVRVAAGSQTTMPSLAGMYVGERIDVYGKLEKKTGTIQATRVEVREVAPGTVSGTGVIDLVPATQTTAAGERVVRADGYLLRVTPATTMQWTAPLAGVQDLTTNVWVDYHGLQQADGTVVVDTLTARANTILHTEDKLREKREFDPAQVDEGDKQGFWSKHLKGVDPRRFPAHNDPAMQARVERIGRSLVPAYQKALPEDDPTKIEFRFQVIEPQSWRDALSLASGIILIPAPVVERMENDAELATVLADNIAEILEKQDVRAIPARQAVTAGAVAGDVAGIFVPGLGLATGLAGGRVEKHMLTVAERQSGRVSLWLLHDAGYDVTQAPRAWWLLETKKSKRLEETSPPVRAVNLYQDLGTTWRTGF